MLTAILDALVPSRGMYDQWDDPSNRSPWADFWYTPLGIPEIAGQPTANSHYFTSACFAATRLLCAIGATSPLNLMRVTTAADGRKKRAVQSNHPIQRMVNFRPNADQTAIQWKSQKIAWQVNWGTTFSEIQRDTITGKVLAFWPIHPRRMRPFRDQEQNLWWHVTQPNGTTEDLRDDEVLRMPYIVSEDGGITGLGVAYQARRSIGLTLTLERSETQASKSGVPRIVVESPKPMSADSRVNFRREWKELYEQGGESVALLTEDAKVKPLSFSAVDAQHVERREFLIEEVARWYDIPLALLRRAIKELAGNVEQQGIDFKTYSLRFLDVWLQELAYKLLTPEEIADGYYFAFDFTDLLRGDLKAMGEFLKSMNSVGVYSANDILDRLGENPHDKGDGYFVQGAMRPIDEPYSAIEPQKPKGNPKDGVAPIAAAEPPKNQAAERAVRLLIQATLQRMATKEINKANHEASNKPMAFLSSMEEFYGKHRQQMAESLAPICLAAKELGGNVTADELSAAWCEESIAKLLLASEVCRDQLAESVSSAVSDWNSRRVDDRLASLNVAA